MKHFLPIILLPFIISCSSSTTTDSSVPLNKFQDSIIRHIYTLQDERKTDSLLLYFTNPNPVYRSEAALAFASVQDTLAIPMLGKLLEDDDDIVRISAAYALGQIRDSSAEAYLLPAIGRESKAEVVSEKLESLGKCCSRKGLQLLCDWQGNDSLSQAGQMWGLFRAGQRKIYKPEGAAAAVKRLGPENAYTVRLGAANFLGRTRNIDLTLHSVEIEKAIHAEPAYDVRMMEVSALGKIKPVNAGLLCTLSGGDPDYRVRINAIRAMKGTEYTQVSHHLYNALKDKNVNVAIASAEFIQENVSGDEAGILFKNAVEHANWRVSSLLLSAAMKVGNQQERSQEFNQYMLSRYQKSTNVYEKAALLLAMAKDVNNYSFIEKKIFSAEHVVISTCGIEALADIRRSPDFKKEWEQHFFQVFRQAVQTGDVALVGTVATAMRDTALKFKPLYAGSYFLDSAMMKLSIPRDIETKIEIQKTLDYLRGITNTKKLTTPYNHPVNWERVKQIPLSQRVLITTSRGNIRLHLFVEAAPGSVSSFIELAEKGFYDNKTIHRVVPNFVAQDGCPRGDGWGGTDFSLRSEFSRLHYMEGYVGLASAGKDTESCQWFITHSPTPHLDGNYTIFGKVVEGMHVVHLLEVGDKIIKVEVLK